jgi:hypothetical protein
VRLAELLCRRLSAPFLEKSFDLRRANEILKSASFVFRAGARRRPAEMTRFIDQRRGRFGVERIGWTLEASASAYYQRACGSRSQ